MSFLAFIHANAIENTDWIEKSAMQCHTTVTLTIIKADMMITVMDHTSLASGFSYHMETDGNSHEKSSVSHVVLLKNIS